MNDDGYVFVMIVTPEEFYCCRRLLESICETKENRQTHTTNKVSVIAQVEEQTHMFESTVFVI